MRFAEQNTVVKLEGHDGTASWDSQQGLRALFLKLCKVHYACMTSLHHSSAGSSFATRTADKLSLSSMLNYQSQPVCFHYEVLSDRSESVVRRLVRVATFVLVSCCLYMSWGSGNQQPLDIVDQDGSYQFLMAYYSPSPISDIKKNPDNPNILLSITCSTKKTVTFAQCVK